MFNKSNLASLIQNVITQKKISGNRDDFIGLSIEILIPYKWILPLVNEKYLPVIERLL